MKNVTVHNVFPMVEKILLVKSLALILILSVFTSFAILVLAPNYLMVIGIVFIPFMLILIWNKPFIFLQILILVMPFSVMPFLNIQIMKIPGLTPINILVVVTFFAFIFANLTTNISFNEKLFILGMLSVLLVAVLRSVPQIPTINIELEETFGFFRFFQSFFFKPIIYFSFFIFISLYVCNYGTIETLLKTLIYSMLNLSIILLAIFVFLTPDKTDFDNIRESFSSVVHLHGNNIATIYIISFPLLISYYYMKKNWLSIVSIALCLIVIGLLYSRTAYFLVFLTIFIYLFFSKRLNWTPVIFGIILIMINFLPSSISERALTGIESHDSYQLSAGRVSDIWVPLINEIVQSPEKLFFGSGRRAILFSDAYKNGHIYDTGHAHNLYLNTVLEIGLLGLTFFGIFYFVFIKYIFKTIKKYWNSPNEREILLGVVVSTICFLIAGLTGREIFPNNANYPIWFVLAIGSAILKIQTKKETV